MQTLIKTLSRTMAIAAVAGVLSSQMMVGEAMAQGSFTTCTSQGRGYIFSNGGGCYSDANCTILAAPGTCVPEMSDYMAMVLAALTVGSAYYIRRRALAAA